MSGVTGVTHTAMPRATADLEGLSSWSRVHAQITDAADAFFYKLGYRVAKNAKLTLSVSLLLVVACGFGFTKLNVVTAGERRRTSLQGFPTKCRVSN